MKALIVEDELVSRNLIKTLLAQKFTCETADTGKKAIEMFSGAFALGKPYDIVFLDYMIPEIDGLGVLKLIRSIETEKKIAGSERTKVVMTTVMDDPAFVMESFKSQCDGFIIKPYSYSKISDIIEKLLPGVDQVYL